MRAASASKIAIAAALGLLLSACSGSGNGGTGTGDNAACTTADCENGTPQAPPPEVPLACSAVEGTKCPQGYHCAGERADACDPSNAGACAGTCVLGDELPRCGQTDGLCPDGYVCADDPTDTCDGGPAADCPGACRPAATGECSSDADCPQLEAPCSVCADGTVSCPTSRCDGGKCTANFQPCNEAQVCGGISGLTCAPGLRCIDDPADDCVPDMGGADCRGICVPEEKPRQCDPGDPTTGVTCPPGFECVDDPSDMCEPDSQGAGCPTLCQPGDGGECTTDADCPPLPGPCSICADGTEACLRTFCEAGRCGIEGPSCPPPAGCSDDAECPPGEVCKSAPNGCDPATGAADCGGVCVPSDEPRACGGIGGDTCPDGYTCVDDRRDECDPDTAGADCPGVCELKPPPPCTSDEECQPPIALPCPICPDGSSACPRGECTNGVCSIVFGACAEPGFCGGIAGFPCAPGFTCIDDPNDDCDPKRGGADCGGLCVRQEEPPKCGGIAGQTCPPGYECADSPQSADDGCDASSGADCPGVCKPSMGDACTSDADCPQIGAPCMLCADGTAACPRSFCENGLCRAEFDSCRPAP